MPNVKDILSMTRSEVARMNIKDMREALGILRDAGNKRLKRLEETGEANYSTAYKNLVEYWQDNPRFKVDKNWTRNQVYSELTRAYNFMQNKTSTARGTQQVSRKAYQRISGNNTGTWKTRAEESEFWHEYNKYKKEAMSKGFEFDSKQVQKAIKYLFDNKLDVDNNTIQDGLNVVADWGGGDDTLPD